MLWVALGVGALVGGSVCSWQMRRRRRLRQERYKNIVDERLGGAVALEIVASPLHVDLLGNGMPGTPLPQPAAQVQLTPPVVQPPEATAEA